mgnify:CR=1 FL=1
MDAKITKKRLGIMLSYDWIKIIAICAAVVVVWSLIFTMTATKATIGQQFGVYGYPGVSIDSSHLGDLSDMRSDDVREGGGLSYDVLDYSVNTYGSRSDAGTVLSAHIPAGSADIMFTNSVDTIDNKGDEDPSNDTVTQASGYQTFVQTYRAHCAWLGDPDTPVLGHKYNTNYFLDCENYLKRFFSFESGDYEGLKNAELDRAAAESNFRSRMKKDKRYKNEGQIQEGLQDEYKRLLSLRDAYADVQSWLQDGTLSLASVDIEVQAEDGSEETTTEKWTYAFDLSKVPNITYVLRNSEQEGSAEGLCMSIINTGSSGEEDRRYEPFTFLAYIVDLCAAQAAA